MSESAIFQIDLGLDKEYEPWIYDLLKVLSIHLTVHLLLYYTGMEKGDYLFNQRWMAILIFSLVGMSVYHLITRKLIKVSPEKQETFLTVNY